MGNKLIDIKKLFIDVDFVKTTPMLGMKKNYKALIS